MPGPAAEKYLVTGCWGNLNKGAGNLKNVLETLKRTIKPQDKAVLILGDNYYMAKSKDKSKDKPQKVADLVLLKKAFVMLKEAVPEGVRIKM